jgi:hypothetical protein
VSRARDTSGRGAGVSRRFATARRKAQQTPHRAAGEPSPRRRGWALRLARNLAFTAPIAMVLWLLVSPFLSLFISKAGERLTRLFERPAVTRIELSQGEDALISRADTRAGGRLPYGVRVTDIHFPLVLLIAIFLATPDIGSRERFANLGYALLIVLFFFILDLFFWVKFAYATQLGAWSAAHYGPLARNFWGLGKHVLDLPVKLALPFALWAAFYLRQLTGELFGEPNS